MNGKRFDVAESLIITSEPRSGSTWLMEILGSQPDVVVNWEPLHPVHGAVPPGVHLGWRPSPPPSGDAEDAGRIYHDILTFRRSSVWSDKYVEFDKLLRARHVLTKFVRANRLLPWLSDYFHLKYKPVYLVRHPIAVAASQLKNFGPPRKIWDTIPSEEVFLDQPTLNEFMDTLTSDLEFQVAQWCMLNARLLRLYREGSRGWIQIFYEDIVVAPEAVIAVLNAELGKTIDPDFVDWRKPSKSDFRGDFLAASAPEQLTKYVADLSREETDRIQQILDFFGIIEYTAFDALPVLRKVL